MNIYVTSDTHYAHKNMCKGESDWKDGWRDISTLQEMNKLIVDGINTTVKKDDVLYHLGDWSFGGIDKIWEFRRQVECKNIHLILGNHDEHIEDNKKIRIYKSDMKVFQSIDKHWIGDSFWEDTGYVEVELKRLFTSVNHVHTMRAEGNKFFLSHYAHRIWLKSHHGVHHLYGHSHDSLEYEQWGKSMDVGIDSAKRILGEYRPFTIKEIINILSARSINVIDHHNGKSRQ